MPLQKPRDVKRDRAEWMAGIHDHILETLHDVGNLQPSEVADRIRKNPSYTGSKCRELARYGLVKNMGSGTYSITEQGREYLAGELDASELEQDDS
jgi:Mn-dependent DtxR family transcriptional regulator